MVKRRITDWRTWLHGLIAAAIGGAANAITMVVVDPLEFNFAQWGPLWKVSIVSAVVNAAFYLKHAKLPELDGLQEDSDTLQPHNSKVMEKKLSAHENTTLPPVTTPAGSEHSQ